MSFASLGIAEPVARALAEARHSVPTPIQAAAIPVALAGRDLIGVAQTGTGKTAAFAVPILHRLAVDRRRPQPGTCRVLVLSPTRELASQIAASFTTYGSHVGVKIALAIGGVPIARQVRELARGADILVATPGRLVDLCRSRSVTLSATDCLVLDEADRMLDMGFIHDVRRLVAMLPRRRQTLLFSATMPGEIARLAEDMLSDPVSVGVTPPASTVARVDQRVLFISREGKAARLAETLRGEPIDRALVFTRTKRGADRLVRALASSGVAAEAIHGNKSQSQRERVLAAFRAGSVRNLVATDIAARGIDVTGITHVVNYDMPNDPESYVHRIGRTARAGRTGTAISFCSQDEIPILRSIEKVIRRDIAVAPDGERLETLAEERPPVPPRNRSRRSRGGAVYSKRSRNRGDRPRAAAGRHGHATSL
jgi:ATP-dependent RNA helicase RhlE